MRAIVIVVVFGSCGREPALPDASSAFCTDAAPRAPTFANVQELFTGVCTTCHLPSVPLDLGASVSYANLIGKPPPSYTDPVTDESCGGVLVKPGDPLASYLFQKVSLDAPCAGSRMPLTDIGVPSPLLPCAQTMIHDWIAAGALDD